MKSEDVPISSYFKESIREILLGSISGAAGKVIEYPFDTIKVRLQYSQSLSKPLFNSTLDCIVKTHQNEGIFGGFYKGLTSPLLGALMEYASLFWSYDLSKIFLAKYLSVQRESDLDLKWKMVAGGISGLVTSFVLTPIELVKCQMQVHNLNSKANSSTVAKTIAEIFAPQGAKSSIVNFWKGQSSTLIRETGGTMFWFGTYEYALLCFQKLNKIKENSNLQLLASGAAAGITYNLSFFPIDTVKSVMQTTTSQKSYLPIVKDIYKKNGIKGFYSGCGITVIRAIPSNAIVFYLYETMKKRFLLD